MKKERIRVMLASEYPEIRYFLKEMTEAEESVAVVGQAKNALTALTLARNLRPDVAIVDSYLPHSIGLDDVPLSRISGLDAAQAISEEIPRARVVVLNRPKDKVLQDDPEETDTSAFFCKEGNGGHASFTLGELRAETVHPFPLVFAHVEARRRTRISQKAVSNLGDSAIFIGFLALGAGAILILTILAGAAGVFLALAGLLALVLGGVAKAVSKLLPK